jgi:hypothetical protein
MKGIKPLSKILHSQEMETLQDKVKQYIQLRSAVHKALPPLLRTLVQLAPIEQGTLTLRCANGTVHLRLRTLLPDVIDSVRAAGFQLKEIRLKVDPIYQALPQAKKKIHRSISEAGRNALEQARQQCSGTPLAESIQHLLDNTRKR